MERLNDIGAKELARLGLRKQLMRQEGVPAYEAQPVSRLPTGSFLLSEEDDQEVVEGTISPTAESTDERRRVVGRGLPKARPSLQLVPLSEPKDQVPQPAATRPDVCPLCKGAGFTRADVPFGHPAFGKPVECKCKLEQKKEAQRLRLREQSQIDHLAAFQEEAFETFQLWLPGVQAAYEAVAQWSLAPLGWLLLEGPNGCGKTHLAVATAKCCIEQGIAVLFAVVPDLLDDLRTTFAPGAEECYDETFQRMKQVEILILDDLGAQSNTAWAQEKLFQLLNYRYNARLATMVTTNRIDLEGIEPRIRSRLRDKRLVRRIAMTEAQDFREMEPDQ